ncbi:AEC family transporter [Kineosporia babensis]|uniref:AEC family transporter n=1 Tax=Kineosporia babensis TaxID=499548 RepID=A0A9X1NEJ4_9ACTN|nr:AEC family transporter [Kineosporia babensis]MCD5312389.1 AEC family transporter [Kineosporia babensis]
MHLVATGVIPIVVLLGLGAVLRRFFLREDGFWRGLEWASYQVFTPALFVSSISAADLTAVPPGPLLVSLMVPVLVVALFVIALRRPLRFEGPQLTSMVQGSIRLNTYIGLVFASALYGAEGVATFALAAAVMVPLVNVISVTTLSVYGEKEPEQRRVGLRRELMENPLIQGCALGLAINVSGLELPAFAATTISMLAEPALVCGTLVAGAAITFQLRARDTFDIGAAALLKLVALPSAAAALATTLGVSGATLASIVIICALPTAPSSYVLAGRMGGDTRLMASITGVQTILAVVTLPLIITLAAGR